ncbi:MAG: hypothetical protein KAI74_07675 [Kiritimatiellae bacterium]|nr:hypothetical protein [Kiritimatiellia bacterium]
MKMSKHATEEYMLRMRGRYSCLTKKVAKTHLLDEFCNITGYDRKHATKLLNGKSGNRTNKISSRSWRNPAIDLRLAKTATHLQKAIIRKNGDIITITTCFLM